MNTTTKTASTATILAVDLGKYNSVACVRDRGSGEFRFTSVQTTRAELCRVIGKEQPAVAIVEASLLAGWVHDLCAELGIRRPSTQGDTSPDLRVEDFAASCGDQGAHCRPLDPVSLSQLPGRKDMNR